MTDETTAPLNPEKTAMSGEFKHTRPLTACHWDPLSRYVFFGSEDNQVHRLHLESKEIVSLSAHDSWVRSFGTSPDGKFLYSGGYDGRLGVWEIEASEPKPVRMFEAHRGWIRSLAVSPDGGQIATCGNDLLVKLWDAIDGSLLSEFKGHQSHVYNLAFVGQPHDSLVSCDLKGVVFQWSLDGGEPREVVTVEALHGYDTTFRADIGGARGIAVAGNQTQVALAGITKVTNAFAGVGEIAAALVNLESGKLERVMQSKDKTGGTLWGVAHHPDGFWIGLSGGRGGGWLWFWKGDVEQEFFRLKLKNDGRSMSLSPDKSQIAVAHADSHLRIYTIGST